MPGSIGRKVNELDSATSSEGLLDSGVRRKRLSYPLLVHPRFIERERQSLTSSRIFIRHLKCVFGADSRTKPPHICHMDPRLRLLTILPRYPRQVSMSRWVVWISSNNARKRRYCFFTSLKMKVRATKNQRDKQVDNEDRGVVHFRLS